MTRLTDSHKGGETGHVHAEGVSVSGTSPTFDTSVKRSGTRSYKFDASGQALVDYDFVGGATGVRYFATCWFYLPAATGYPGANSRIFGITTTGFTALWSARLTTTGKIQAILGTSTQQGSDSSETVATDTWHRLDLILEINPAAAADYAEVLLNGVSVASTSANISDSTPGKLYWGWNDDPGTSEVIHFDDIILNDDNGSDNNTLADDEKVILLLPTADSARDTNWVGGGGGTTSLFEAVNNIPPAGLDNGSATNTSQIENAASTTTEEYDATMATYSSAGIQSYDTITAIYAVIEGGNSSTTGSDTIGVSVESNPVIAETTPSIDVNDNTYPSGWNRGATGISEMPSVTVGTAPVMSVRKNIASTRVSTVCFMGMYVSYVEGTPPVASGRGPQVIWIG